MNKFDPITISCPFCHAKPGDPCTMNPAFGTHFSRIPTGNPVTIDMARVEERILANGGVGYEEA